MTSRPFLAAGLVLVSLCFQQLGAVFGVLVFPDVGPAGIVTIRLTFAAIILLAVARPRLRGYSARDWLVVTAFGLALAGMNHTYYASLAYIPIGATSTIELLGPLTLAVVAARTVSGWLSALLAAVGVVLLGIAGFGSLDVPGVAYALGSAVLWACYILLSVRTGRRFPKLDGIAIAMAIGAVLTMPFGIALAGTALLDWRILGIGLLIAVLSSAIPYALELVALRRIRAGTFSVLVSLNPAIAAGLGALVLHQFLSWVEVLAIALVATASIMAVRAAAAVGRAEDATPGASVTPD